MRVAGHVISLSPSPRQRKSSANVKLIGVRAPYDLEVWANARGCPAAALRARRTGRHDYGRAP